VARLEAENRELRDGVAPASTETREKIVVQEKIVEKRVEVPVITPELADHFRETAHGMIATGKDLATQGNELLALGKGILHKLETAHIPETGESTDGKDGAEESSTPPDEPKPPKDEPVKPGKTPTPTAGGLASPLLAALARYPDGLVQYELAIASGMALTNKEVFQSALKAEIRARNIQVVENDKLKVFFLKLTEAGEAKARPESAPTGPVLLHLYESQLNDRAAGALHTLVEGAPRAYSRSELAKYNSYAPGGSYSRGIAALTESPLVFEESQGKFKAATLLVKIIKG
jgi:hypothetical protein